MSKLNQLTRIYWNFKTLQIQGQTKKNLPDFRMNHRVTEPFQQTPQLRSRDSER